MNFKSTSPLSPKVDITISYLLHQIWLHDYKFKKSNVYRKFYFYIDGNSLLLVLHVLNLPFLFNYYSMVESDRSTKKKLTPFKLKTCCLTSFFFFDHPQNIQICSLSLLLRKCRPNYPFIWTASNITALSLSLLWLSDAWAFFLFWTTAILRSVKRLIQLKISNNNFWRFAGRRNGQKFDFFTSGSSSFRVSCQLWSSNSRRKW